MEELAYIVLLITTPTAEEAAKKHGKELLDAHQRVRKAMQVRGVSYEIEPKTAT